MLNYSLLFGEDIFIMVLVVKNKEKRCRYQKEDILNLGVLKDVHIGNLASPHWLNVLIAISLNCHIGSALSVDIMMVKK